MTVGRAGACYNAQHQGARTVLVAASGSAKLRGAFARESLSQLRDGHKSQPAAIARAGLSDAEQNLHTLVRILLPQLRHFGVLRVLKQQRTARLPLPGVVERPLAVGVGALPAVLDPGDGWIGALAA